MLRLYNGAAERLSNQIKEQPQTGRLDAVKSRSRTVRPAARQEEAFRQREHSLPDFLELFSARPLNYDGDPSFAT